MFLRLLFESFRRQQRRKLLAGVAVMLGVAVSTAMIAIGVDVGDKMNRELRSVGANIVVEPDTQALEVNIGGHSIVPAGRQQYLKESSLPKIKTIFWGHNIVAFAPFLTTDAEIKGATVPVIGTYFDRQLQIGKEAFTTGVRKTYPFWQVTGSWPADDSHSVLVGTKLASRLGLAPGAHLSLGGEPTEVAGILSTGGTEDDAVIAPLPVAQALAHAPDSVERIYVSALTKPEDDFARRDPEKMPPAMRDRWYCSPYANSIAYQLREAFPGAKAEQIRRVAQSEGQVLSRISGLMLLVTLAALIAAVLAVSAAMATTVLERSREVGLMKSLGATSATIATLFFSEASIIGLAGGVLGFGIGVVLARVIGSSIFGARVAISPVLLPFTLAVAVLITIAGSAAAVRRAVSFDPAVVLRGNA